MTINGSITKHKRRRRLFLLASATLPAILHASNNNSNGISDHQLSVTDNVLSSNTRMTKSKLRELHNLSRILKQLHSRNELSADTMGILHSLENADRVDAHGGSTVHTSEQTGKRRRLTDDRSHREIDHLERHPFKEYRPNLRRGLLSPKVEPTDEQQEYMNQNDRNLEKTRAVHRNDRSLSSSKSGGSEITMDWATYPPAPAPLSYTNYMRKSTDNTFADSTDDGNDENFAQTMGDDDTGVDDGLFEKLHYVEDYEECYEYQDLEYDDDGAYLFEDLTPVITEGGDSGKGSGDQVENDNEEDTEDHKDDDEEKETGASGDDDKKDDNEDDDHKGEDNKDDDMDSNGDKNDEEEEREEDEKHEDEEEEEEEEEAEKDDDKESEVDDEDDEQNETDGEDEEEKEEDEVKNDDVDPDAGVTNTETPSISPEKASPTIASDTAIPTSTSETASPTTASETDSPTTTVVDTTSPSIASATDSPSIASVTTSPSVTTATTSPVSSDTSSPSTAPASIGPSIVSATVSPSIVSATTSPSISSTTDSTESPTFTIRRLQNTIYVYNYAKSGKATKSSKHDRTYLSSSSSAVAETSKDDDVTLPGNNVVFVTMPNQYHGKSSKSTAKSGKTKSGKECLIIKKDDEEVEISDGYCGEDFDHASSKCEEKCKIDADCSGNDSCFGGIRECSPKPEEEGDKYCGEDASDANKCTDKCEVDSDCPSGESCYSDVTECMKEVKDQYCGIDLMDATKCATKCEVDDDCSGDESCFADITDCSEGEDSSQPTSAPTRTSCPEGCIDCDPEAPLLCPPPELKRVCDKHNNELYPPGDLREGEREANFIDCYEMCKPSFCCIHDSASKEYAPSCSQEFENCPLYYPCYIIWWKLHDTIGPATYMRVEQDEPFYEGVQLEYFQQDFVQDQTFFQQFFGHHFDVDDAPTDDTFENEENW